MLALSEAIPREGKALVTAAALRDTLLVDAILLKHTAGICETLVQLIKPQAPQHDVDKAKKDARSARKVRASLEFFLKKSGLGKPV